MHDTYDYMQAPSHIALPSVSASAMLVELSFSCWTGRKKDKRAKEQIARHYGANVRAVNATKVLLGDCPELDAIQKFKAHVQTGYHYRATLPWSDSGLRILPTVRYPEYHAEMTAFQTRYYELVEALLEKYAWYAAEAQVQLGSLFARDEYPTPETLREKFAMRINYMPLPESGDFRVDVGEQATATLRQHYEQHYTSMLERASVDVWRRAHDSISRLVKSLGETADGKRGRLYETTFDSVRNLVEDMRVFNLTNDPSMEEARRKLEEAMSGVSLPALKEDDDGRDITADKLQDVLASLPSLDLR